MFKGEKVEMQETRVAPGTNGYASLHICPKCGKRVAKTQAECPYCNEKIFAEEDFVFTNRLD